MLRFAKVFTFSSPKVLVAAASRRIDSNAGRLLKVVLEMTDSPWDLQTSQPFYSTDVAVRVSSL